MIGSFLPKPSGQAASWEEVDAQWEGIDKTPEEKEAERIAATTKRTEEIPQSDDDPKLTRIRKQSEAVIHNLGVDYPHLFEAIKVTSKFVDETIKQSDIAPVANILEEGSKKAARGAEMWATGSDIYNPITKQQIGTLPDLDVDPAAARFIGSTTFGAATESTVFKAIAAAKKIKVDFPTGGGQQLIPVGNNIPISNQFDNVVSKIDDLPSTAQPLQSIAGVQPSHWHRRYRKAITPEDKLKVLNTPLSRQLKNKSVKGGKITANKLVKDEKLINKLVERADGIIDRYIKGDQRKLYDYASHNIFSDAHAVYGTGLVKKIQQVFLVTQGKEWHHIFGNKEAGEFILNKIAQDPVLTANLFKHLDNLTIKSGAVAENMALMKLKPHKLWHEFMQQLGTESRVKMLGTDTLENLDARGLLAQNRKRQPFSRVPVEERKLRMGTVDNVKTGTVLQEQPWKYTAPLDVADYGHEIADAIFKGKADVDELFTFLTVYHDRYLPWVKQKLKDPKFASTFLADLPDGPEKALLTGLYKTEKGPGRASLGTRGMKKRN
jgi:hypothetical protein